MNQINIKQIQEEKHLDQCNDPSDLHRVKICVTPLLSSLHSFATGSKADGLTGMVDQFLIMKGMSLSLLVMNISEDSSSAFQWGTVISWSSIGL